MTTVSVIIPTHNRAELLPRAIRSVLNQTFQDFEIIIVDDASTDNTEEVVSKFFNQKKSSIKANQKITYLKNEMNRGAAFSRNKGIKFAKSPLISFLDSDDEYTVDRLMKLYNVFQKHNSIDLIYHDYWSIEEKQKRYISIEEKQKGIELLPIYRNVFYILPGCIAMKRDCLHKLGFFDENLGPYEEWDFLIRTTKFCKFYYLKEALYKWHTSGTNYSLIIINNIRALTKFFYKYHKELYSNREKIGMFYAFLSSWYAKRKQKLAAIKYQLTASIFCAKLKYYKRLFHLSVGDTLYYSLRKAFRNFMKLILRNL